MINSADIQRAYDYLYTCIRNYIWGFDVIESLVDLEISCYKACPDLADIKRNCDRLQLLIRSELSDDAELKDAIEALHDLVDTDGPTYATLTRVNEVTEYNEDSEEFDEEERAEESDIDVDVEESGEDEEA